ncbi:MAG: hypothetical protein PVF83_05890 [Anaerolineales bacterium]
MRRIIRITPVIIFVLFAFLPAGRPASAQVETNRFFSDTGHWLVGEFYDFYTAYERADLVFGFPITDEFLDELTGLTVQYFENVRFELHPENPHGLQVVVTPLGQILYEPAEPIQLNSLSPNCRQALDWDFPVCFSFFDFYLVNGGQTRFGVPISGLEYSRGYLVQHFEYARMVWKPGHPQGAQVTLAPLGEEYFYFIGEDPIRLEPVRNNMYSAGISELHIKAFTRHAVVFPGKLQTLYVMVTDQNGAPVIGGRVTIRVEFPDGSSETFSTVATNDLGLAEFTFPASSIGLGMANVTIAVLYGDILQTSLTSFRVWY